MNIDLGADVSGVVALLAGMKCEANLRALPLVALVALASCTSGIPAVAGSSSSDPEPTVEVVIDDPLFPFMPTPTVSRGRAV